MQVLVQGPIQNQVWALVQDEVHSLVQHQVQALVQDQVRTLVPNQVQALVQDRVRALVQAMVQDQIEALVNSINFVIDPSKCPCTVASLTFTELFNIDYVVGYYLFVYGLVK